MGNTLTLKSNTMKRLILFILPVICIANAQCIDKNGVDEFTKKKTVTTSYKFIIANFSHSMSWRLLSNGGTPILDLRYFMSSVTSITESHTLYIKVSNDSVISLKPSGSFIWCSTCGAMNGMGGGTNGINPLYPISVDQIKFLCDKSPIKMRMETSDGYVEFEIASGAQGKFVSCAREFLTAIQ